jgi:thymidylate synthase (FAD)
MMIADVLPPYGTVELVSAHANDNMVCDAARVSTGAAQKFGTLDKKDVGLIKFLMREKHGTPFEHNYFQFRVRAPIFVMREWHRHRVGVSINEESGRYSELKNEVYWPAHVHTQSGKPGAYRYEEMGAITSGKMQEHFIAHHSYCHKVYQLLLANGVSRQEARLVLPVAQYSTMMWSCNARSLMNFLSLRCAETAQWEIRQYALAMETMFHEVMPVTACAFGDSGRIAP